jgi:uncharacterized protein (TIGR02996 family)
MPGADHPEYEALLRAICAEPDDDTPRLVAADWLEEHGLEEHGDADRAAFIRIQVELARLEAAGLGKSLDADALRKNERAYFGPYSYFWRLWAAEACPQLVWVNPGRGTNALADIYVEGAHRLTFRRGFVEAVECPATDWLQHGTGVRGRQPIRDVTLTHCDQLTRDHWYTMLPAIRGLRRLQLTDCDDRIALWLQARLPEVGVACVPF